MNYKNNRSIATLLIATCCAFAPLTTAFADHHEPAQTLTGKVQQFYAKLSAGEFADAMDMLGEAYFRSEQYLSARRVFNTMVERASDRRFDRFREHAVLRLVDVALRLRDPSALDALLAKISGGAGLSGASQGALAYARGKGLLAQGKLRLQGENVVQGDPE